jgi:hypothetical protein
MADWLISILGVLCAAAVGFTGIILGKRSQVKKIKDLKKKQVKRDVDEAEDRLEAIDKSTKTRVTNIVKEETRVDSLDGDDLADEFNSAFK